MGTPPFLGFARETIVDGSRAESMSRKRDGEEVYHASLILQRVFITYQVDVRFLPLTQDGWKSMIKCNVER
jgi:hypothetical protein